MTLPLFLTEFAVNQWGEKHQKKINHAKQGNSFSGNRPEVWPAAREESAQSWVLWKDGAVGQQDRPRLV